METVTLTGMRCVFLAISVHCFLSMSWNLYQAFYFPPHFYLSAIGMKRAGKYFRKLTRTLK